jgi:hypothetical protein
MSETIDPKSSQDITHHNKRLAVGMWAVVLALCVGAITYIALKPLPSSPELPIPPEASAPGRSSVRARFFDEQIQPAITAADTANRQAKDRCLQNLHDMFEDYRKGIKPFSKDVTSWGTRWGVMRRMPTDWWYNKTDIQQFIAPKFEANLFSEESLAAGLEGALIAFHKDVEANDATLLTEIRAAVSKSDLPDLPSIDYGEFSTDVTRDVQKYSIEAGSGSAKNLVLSLVLQGLAGAAATQLLDAMVTELATTATATAAAAGGEMGGTAAVGGAGGSIAGPVGTAVGVGAGIVVGVIVDWWATSRFEAQLSVQLNGLIDHLETSVIDGSKKRAGLMSSLAEACDIRRDSYRDSLFHRVVQEAK